MPDLTTVATPSPPASVLDRARSFLSRLRPGRLGLRGARLRASERHFRSLIENALDTITIIDAAGTILYESPSVERVLGFRPDELVGRNVFEYVHPADRPAVLREFERLLGEPGRVESIELRFVHRDGQWRTMEVVGRNLLDDPAVEGVIVNARDITERKLAEAQLLFDAFHDKLTGLPNRALFMDRLAQTMKRAQRQGHPSFAVLFLDVDRFKLINDSLGHSAGDRLLVLLAQRLEEAIRPGDTVARLGGDEFTFLLDGIRSLRAAERVSERIHRQLGAPFDLDGRDVFATASIGIAASTEGYERPEEVLRDADLAMYRAKTLGRARHEIFDREMHATAVAALQIETELRHALERGRLRVVYQPIVALGSGELCGFEALVRWKQQGRRLVAPDAFLPIAEESGLILPIGWWVLEQAVLEVGRWNRGRGSPLFVSVNFSARQLAQPNLVHEVAEVMRRTGTPGHLLKIELTETSVMDRPDEAATMLRQLRELGVGVCIDDFGTGYSSLGYLHQLPVDILKIDRSFIARLDAGGHEAGIVRTVLRLARDLDMEVIAEGIESDAQHAALSALGCRYGQGFYFARPVGARTVRSMIRNGRRWRAGG